MPGSPLERHDPAGTVGEGQSGDTDPARQAQSRPFQVHLRGVVELLSRSIYSGSQVYIRELLQNAHDAIAARRELDGKGTRITVTPVSAHSDTLIVADDGIGLDVAEVESLLATVGSSSKRDFLDMPRQDRLGQFGIGLLSCFMVADEIRVVSRSAKPADAAPAADVTSTADLTPSTDATSLADTVAPAGAVEPAGSPNPSNPADADGNLAGPSEEPAPVEWIGHADGTFEVRTLTGSAARKVPIGTRIMLKPRPDDADLARETAVVELVRRYGEYLDTPIDIIRADGHETRVNRDPAFTRPAMADPSALLELGEELVGARPLEAIPLEVPATGTTGVAFVLPYAPAPGARQATRTYLGGMLLNPSLDDLLPDWGFFVRCVVNTTGLHPTASREGLIADSALEETRTQLGAILRRWLLSVAATRPSTLAEFMSVHHMGLKAVAVHDDELARLVLPHVQFETSSGRGPLAELAAAHPRLRYTESVEEFRQLAPLAPADEPLVNAGYVYDAELLRRAPEFVPDLQVTRAHPDELVESLAEPPLEVRAQVTALEDAAQFALTGLGAGVQVRRFSPADVTAIFVADRRGQKATVRGEVAAESAGLFGSLLGKLAAGSSRGPGSGAGERGRLCLNWNSELVRTLAGRALAARSQETSPALSPALRVIYAQALLAGQHPLTRADRRILDGSLTDIVKLSLDNTAQDETSGDQPLDQHK